MDLAEEFYESIKQLDYTKMKAMVKAGCSPNIMRTYSSKNAALELLSQGIFQDTLKMLDYLMEEGIEVSQEGYERETILYHLIDWLHWYEISSRGSNVPLFKQVQVTRLKSSFDKLMNLKPDLSKNIQVKDFDIFEMAADAKALYWFEPYVQNMSEEVLDVYKGYRIARLFEEST